MAFDYVKKSSSLPILQRKSIPKLKPSSHTKNTQGPGLTASNILMLQRRFGNAFVQRMIQRKEENEPEAKGSNIADAEEEARLKRAQVDDRIKFSVPAQFNDRGELRLDLSQLLNLQKFGTLASDYAKKLRDWTGLGHFMMDNDGQRIPFQEILTERETLMVKTMPYFRQNLYAAYKKADPQNEPNWNSLFTAGKLDIEATLHYNLEDIEVRDEKFDRLTDIFRGQHILPFPVLLIRIKDQELGKGILPKPFIVDFSLLLQGIFTNPDDTGGEQ